MSKPARDQATLDALTLSPGWLSHRDYRARYGESLAITEQILTHQN